MKVIEGLRNKLRGLIQAANRYPLTMLFLLAIAVVNAMSINTEAKEYSKYLFTFMVGALLSIVGQQMYERFFIKSSERFMLMGVAILLAAAYYFTIKTSSVFNVETGTKTGVIMFALIIAFIWVPTIKSRIAFSESFLSTFKAFFITILFTGVIAGGVSAILFAIDTLLFSMDYKVNSHVLNIIYSLFAPIFFLSFTPPYRGKRNANQTDEELTLQEEQINKAISCPKFLEILLSYIIIPLAAVYTVILLCYVILNINGDFWTKNLLEPLLVSYAITVILVYILTSGLENKFADLFRMVFPKVLVPIVLFQTVASILKINEMGITYGRYYVILFGIFAIIAGLIFSFFSTKKNGAIAPILIVLSVISIVPPIDAFTVSRVNQIHLLKDTLIKNHMLENNTIVPNSDILTNDKKIITKTVSYLETMNYSDEIDWLPDKIYYEDNFKKTFGFEEVYDEPSSNNQDKYVNLDWEESPIMNIEGYDRMIHLSVYTPQRGMDETDKTIPIEKSGRTYTFTKEHEGETYIIRLRDENDKELIRLDTKDILHTVFENYNGNYEGKENMLTVEEATIPYENDQVKVSVLVNSANYYDSNYDSDMYFFIKIK